MGALAARDGSAPKSLGLTYNSTTCARFKPSCPACKGLAKTSHLLPGRSMSSR